MDGLDSNRLRIETLQNELELLKNQRCDVPIELIQKIEDQQRDLADSKEIATVLAKFGNNPDGMSALHYAIKLGDINAVSILLNNGADSNSKDIHHAHTALTLAASCNQLEIVHLLLDSGANVNLTATKESYFPIYYAAQSGSGDLITLLVQFGAKLDSTNDSKSIRYPLNPLHIACGAGNFEAIKALIYHRARIDGFINWQIKEPDYLKWQEGTPLDWAICKLTYDANPQNLEIIKYLVENGATRRVTNLYQHGASDYEYCPVIGEYLKSVGFSQF